MKREIRLNAHVTAKLCTDKDVPFPRESPLLVLASTANATEGLGGYGAADEIEVSGSERLQQLAALLGELNTAPQDAVTADTWVSPHKELPAPDAVVVCLLQHASTLGFQEHLLRRVADEDDCDWRTADDNSEVSYDWTVVAWKRRGGTKS